MYIEKWLLFVFFAVLAWLAAREEEKRRNLEFLVNSLRDRLRKHGISEED